MTTISLELSFKIHDTRQRAARLIEERGWWHGIAGQIPAEFDEEDGPVCLVESVALVADDGQIAKGLLDQLRIELGVYHLAIWNDTEGRTREEVIAALRGTS